MTWLRERMKIFIWITAIAFIIPFVAGTLIRNFMGPQGPRGTLATVNDQAIAVEAYQEIYDQLRQQRSEQQDKPITRDTLNKLRRKAFTQAVNSSLMQQTLSKAGAQATESEIRQLFAQSQAFRNEQGRINRRAVRQALNRLPERRRQQIERSSRRQIESLRMSQWLATQVDSTDSETQILMQEGLREFDLYGLYVDPRNFVDTERARSFYESNREQYRNPPRAYVRHILFQADTRTRLAPGRLNEIKESIQTIRRRFRAGDSFETLARQFSDDTSTANNGGSLGWVTPEDLDQSFANEVFGGDTQDLTNLIRTERGYHLAYVEEGPEITYKPFESVSASIRDRLLSDTHWTQARQKIKELRSNLTRASSPLDQLREIALVQSHSSFASDRAGHYGWVPLRFVLENRHELAGQWQRELLTDNNFIKQPIARTLARLEPRTVSEPVRTGAGFHLFVARDVRSPDPSTVSDTDTRRLTLRIESRKKTSYRDGWLRRERKQAEIELNVPKSRIGGFIPWKK